MKKLLLVLLFFPFFLFSQSEIKLETDLKNYEKYMPTSECGEIIHYNYYSVSFCEDDRISEWAIYYMTPDRIGTSKRTNDFRQDINLNQRDASLEDYKGSGFDRGHLVPAADMSLDKERMSQSFLMTNITPQEPSFNRGIFKTLESQVRSWIYDFDTIVVITGCVDTSSKHQTIGDGEVVVPNFFYKIFVDIKRNRSIAFILPNKKAEKTLFEYVCSIDYLEEFTGLDFFYMLPDDIEESLESEN
jgi:endonuclease G, mitochondrial